MRYFFIGVIVPATNLIPLGAGLYQFKKVSKPSVALFWYVVFAAFFNALSSILASLHTNNLVVLHFYTIAEFWMLSWFMSRVITNKKILKGMWVTAVLFGMLCVVNFVFLQSINKFNTYTRPLEAFLVILYCLAYFEQESKVLQTTRWEKRPINWYVTGLLLYFAGAFFLFIFSNIIITRLSKPTEAFLWNLHGCFVMFMYFLFTVGFGNERRK